MSTSKPTTLTEGAIAALLIRTALPLTLGVLAMMSYAVTDTYFVSQLGEEALTAISFTAPVVMLVISMSLGLGAGISSVLARAVGANNRPHARRLVSDGLLLSVVLSLILTCVGLLTLDPLFLLLGAKPALLPLIRSYMVPFYWGVIVTTTFSTGGAILRAHGEARMSGFLAAVGSILNVVLDPILIFGLLGFPRLEMQGAAIASIIARLIALLIGIVYLLRKRYAAPVIDSPSALAKSWASILHVGLLATASQVLVPIGSAVVLGLLARHGEEAVAAFGIAYRVEPVMLVPMYGLSAIIGPFCGQNFGARKVDRLQKAWRIIGMFCLIFSALAALFLALISPYVVSLFTDDLEIAQIAVSYFWIVPISYGFYGCVMNASAACNGLGRPFPGTVMVFLRVLGLYLPIALLFQAHFGVLGLFAASCLSNIVVGSGSYLWLAGRFTPKRAQEA